MLLLATFALMVPAAISASDRPDAGVLVQQLSVGLSVLLLVAYVLGLVFSLRTHRALFAGVAHAEVEGETTWPVGVAVALLVIVTVVVALVSEVFVGSVQHAALTFGMSPAFVGFVVVAIVGAAAEMTTPSRRRARTGSTSASASRSAVRRRSRCSWHRCWCC